MKLKIRLCYKVILISLLFLIGLLIAGIVYPALSLLARPSVAKIRRDLLKVLWLRWFASILRLQIVKQGDPVSVPALLVSNHISWLDIIVLGRFLPAHFVAKSDIAKWPVIGFLARQSGTIFVSRGDKQQIKATAEKMLWQLRQNGSVIAFPEGTTTDGLGVLPFHASLFQSVLLIKSVVQPVAIQYLGAAAKAAPFIGEDSFVPHLLSMLLLDKIEVKVTFLPAINTEGKNRIAVSNEARSTIVSIVNGEFVDQAASSKANLALTTSH